MSHLGKNVISSSTTAGAAKPGPAGGATKSSGETVTKNIETKRVETGK